MQFAQMDVFMDISTLANLIYFGDDIDSICNATQATQKQDIYSIEV